MHRDFLMCADVYNGGHAGGLCGSMCVGGFLIDLTGGNLDLLPRI